MSLTIPKLDDRTWEDLSEAGRLLIPSLAPGWTNHNPSDPGITLLELFAYFCEGFIYRLDQVTDENIRSFLKLINSDERRHDGPLGDEIRKTMVSLRHQHRAITVDDYESLALSVNKHLGPHAAVHVARAKCWPRHNLRRRGAASTSAEAPAHIALLILPDPFDADTTELLRKLTDLVEQSRVVTTRVQILMPRYLRVGVRLSLTTEAHVATGQVRRDAFDALEKFFSPVQGGLDGQGWPFGRSVYVSEIYKLLVNVPGVRAVNRTRRPGMEKPEDELTIDPAHSDRVRYNRFGELEAIELQADELVESAVRMEDITVISGWRTHAD